MVYESFNLGPSEGQMSDLSQGAEVLLNPVNMDGDVCFRLTGAQLKRVQKAKAAGKGCRLKLSASQLKHNGQHGSGVFSDLLKGGFNLLKPALRSGVKAGISAGKNFAGKQIGKYVDKGLDYAGDFVGDKVNNFTGIGTGSQARLKTPQMQGSGWFGDLVGMLGGSATEQKQMMKMHGSGWFGNILKKLAHGGVDVIAGALGGGLYDKGQGPTATQVKQLRAIQNMHGQGFFSKLLRRGAHGLVDVVGDTFGGAAKINPLSNPNESLWAATHQQKVFPGAGQGLRYN